MPSGIRRSRQRIPGTVSARATDSAGNVGFFGQRSSSRHRRLRVQRQPQAYFSCRRSRLSVSRMAPLGGDSLIVMTRRLWTRAVSDFFWCDYHELRVFHAGQSFTFLTVNPRLRQSTWPAMYRVTGRHLPRLPRPRRRAGRSLRRVRSSEAVVGGSWFCRCSTALSRPRRPRPVGPVDLRLRTGCPPRPGAGGWNQPPIQRNAARGRLTRRTWFPGVWS